MAITIDLIPQSLKEIPGEGLRRHKARRANCQGSFYFNLDLPFMADNLAKLLWFPPLVETQEAFDKVLNNPDEYPELDEVCYGKYLEITKPDPNYIDVPRVNPQGQHLSLLLEQDSKYGASNDGMIAKGSLAFCPDSKRNKKLRKIVKGIKHEYEGSDEDEENVTEVERLLFGPPVKIFNENKYDHAVALDAEKIKRSYWCCFDNCNHFVVGFGDHRTAKKHIWDHCSKIIKEKSCLDSCVLSSFYYNNSTICEYCHKTIYFSTYQSHIINCESKNYLVRKLKFKLLENRFNRFMNFFDHYDKMSNAIMIDGTVAFADALLDQITKYRKDFKETDKKRKKLGLKPLKKNSKFWKKDLKKNGIKRSKRISNSKKMVSAKKNKVLEMPDRELSYSLFDFEDLVPPTSYNHIAVPPTSYIYNYYPSPPSSSGVSSPGEIYVPISAKNFNKNKLIGKVKPIEIKSNNNEFKFMQYDPTTQNFFTEIEPHKNHSQYTSNFSEVSKPLDFNSNSDDFNYSCYIGPESLTQPDSLNFQTGGYFPVTNFPTNNFSFDPNNFNINFQMIQNNILVDPLMYPNALTFQNNIQPTLSSASFSNNRLAFIDNNSPMTIMKINHLLNNKEANKVLGTDIIDY